MERVVSVLANTGRVVAFMASSRAVVTGTPRKLIPAALIAAFFAAGCGDPNAPKPGVTVVGVVVKDGVPFVLPGREVGLGDVEIQLVPLALVGAAVFVGGQALGLAEVPASLAGFAAAFAVRAGAIVFGWALPGFPGRASPDKDA